jgi:homoserine dehydrogenase
MSAAVNTTRSTRVRVGLLGLGTVGQAMVRWLSANASEIERRSGLRFDVTIACVRDLARQRGCELNDLRLVTEPQAVVDADIDVLVELMGGVTPAFEMVAAFLRSGRPVVTANKLLLAERGGELQAIAAKSGAALGFEAAVAGGIPIIKALREGLAGNKISAVAGIINGTSNFILTRMSQAGLSFEAALREAQELGYAEADPRFDVEGIDAAHKLTILASLAFGIPLTPGAVVTEGIQQVFAEDIALAHELGYRIKPLAIGKRSASGVELSVRPTLVPSEQLLAKVDGAFNAVRVRGNAVGSVVLIGRGAGGDATASAVVADLMEMARARPGDAAARPGMLGYQPDALAPLPVAGREKTVSAWYLRLRVADQAGVLRAITAILAELEISVEAILQKEPRAGDDARLALITSAVDEARCDRALLRIRELSFVRGPTSRLRVETFADE